VSLATRDYTEHSDSHTTHDRHGQSSALQVQRRCSVPHVHATRADCKAKSAHAADLLAFDNATRKSHIPRRHTTVRSSAAHSPPTSPNLGDVELLASGHAADTDLHAAQIVQGKKSAFMMPPL
jgi:hypothetical protein